MTIDENKNAGVATDRLDSLVGFHFQPFIQMNKRQGSVVTDFIVPLKYRQRLTIYVHEDFSIRWFQNTPRI